MGLQDKETESTVAALPAAAVVASRHHGCGRQDRMVLVPVTLALVLVLALVVVVLRAAAAVAVIVGVEVVVAAVVANHV